MAVAFAAGLFIDTHEITPGAGLADVSRAKVYTKNVVEIDVDNVQERLLCDSAYFSSVASRALLMQAQAHRLSALIGKTNEVVGTNPAYAASVGAMNGAGRSVQNACNNLDLYVSGLADLSNGKKVKHFEQIYNNALLGYYLVSRKATYGGLFGAEAAADLKSGNSADTSGVKELWGEWVAYELGDKVIAGDYDGAKKALAVSDVEGLGALERLGMMWSPLNQEQLQADYRNQEMLQLITFYDKEQLGAQMVDFLDQAQLNSYFSQEQLNAAGNQEQLQYFNQEQLQYYNQEQLNIPNQEQLQHYNQEQLNIPNQEQLQVPNQEKLNISNQEQLNIPNQEQLQHLNQEQLNLI